MVKNLGEIEVRAREALAKAEAPSLQKESVSDLQEDLLFLSQAVLDPLLPIIRRKFTVPLGADKGQECHLGSTLWTITTEMMAQRDKLREQAANGEDEVQRAVSKLRAQDLEKYATAVLSITIQLWPEEFDRNNFPGFFELAEKHGVTLPEWMEGNNNQNRGIDDANN